MPDERDHVNEATSTSGPEGAGEEHSPQIDVLDQPVPQDQRVQRLLEDEVIDVPQLAAAVEEQEPPDAADTLETLEEEDAAEVLEQMDARAAAEALAEMHTPLAASVLDDLILEQPATAARLLQLMAPDDAADLLQALDPSERATLLAAIPKQAAAQLAQLAGYDKESAGGLMTTDYLALRDEMTVQQAIEHIRATPVSENTHSALVIDAADRLLGIVALRKLLLAGANEPIRALMDESVTVAHPETDREEVAWEMDRYDTDVIPVVDRNRRLLGIVTVDDVIDIIRQEHTEDLQKLVGAGAGEAVYSALSEKLRGRFPWLLVNLFTTAIAAIVVLTFEPLIEELAILAVLMPMIAATAGNAGQQALAVTLRGIVLDEVRPDRVWPLVLREGAVGLLIGVVLGGTLALALALLGPVWESANWRLGIVAGASLAVSMGIGTLAGSLIPILMRRIGFDPATASAIILITITDAVAFATFLGCAQMLSAWLLAAR